MTSRIELKTQRLTLRPVEDQDVESVFSYRSDVFTNKYQGWIPETIEDVNNFF